MSVTRTLTSLTDIGECAEHITFKALASPLMSMDNTYRLALLKDGKERGTTLPFLLFVAIKAKLMHEKGLKKEPLDRSIEKQARSVLSGLLSSIHDFADDADEKVLVSRTLHEMMFRSLVWQEPLLIRSDEQLLRNIKRNHSHTVSRYHDVPSTSLPPYLCRWMLEKDGLNPDTRFTSINSALKAFVSGVYEPLSIYDRSAWEKKTTFSRRAQNALTYKALLTAMPYLDDMVFARPEE